jgi:hypothetical protein
MGGAISSLAARLSGENAALTERQGGVHRLQRLKYAPLIHRPYLIMRNVSVAVLRALGSDLFGMQNTFNVLSVQRAACMGDLTADLAELVELVEQRGKHARA